MPKLNTRNCSLYFRLIYTCEKFTSFCQVLKRCTQEKLPHGVYCQFAGRRRVERSLQRRQSSSRLARYDAVGGRLAQISSVSVTAHLFLSVRQQEYSRSCDGFFTKLGVRIFIERKESITF